MKCLTRQVERKRNDLAKLKECRESISNKIKSLNSQLRSDSEIEILISDLRELTNEQAKLHINFKKRKLILD